jgi:hypothetical protein
MVQQVREFSHATFQQRQHHLRPESLVLQKANAGVKSIMHTYGSRYTSRHVIMCALCVYNAQLHDIKYFSKNPGKLPPSNLMSTTKIAFFTHIMRVFSSLETGALKRQNSASVLKDIQ